MTRKLADILEDITALEIKQTLSGKGLVGAELDALRAEARNHPSSTGRDLPPIIGYMGVPLNGR